MLQSIGIRPRNDFGSVTALGQLLMSDQLLMPYQIDVSDAVLFDVPLVVVLFEDTDYTVAWLPSLFLAETALFSHSVTGDTVRTYSEGLLAWCRYLVDHSCRVEDATEIHFKQFRNLLTHELTARGNRKRSSATIALTLRIVAIFYEWGEQQELFHSSLGKWIADNKALVRTQYSDSDVYRRRGRIGIPLVTNKLPVALPTEKVSKLVASVPNPYSLAFKWAVCTGIRRFELCQLSVEQIVEARESIGRQDVLGKLTIRRKGDKNLNLYVPRGLLDETWWYIQVERGEPIRPDDTHVFLKNGSPLSRETLSSAYSRAAMEANCASTLHHLRHTFAITAFDVLSEKAAQGVRINPLKVLQILLGHASMKTAEIYLQATQVRSDSVRSALDYLYGAT
ncbi:site-specific integrase [Paraburkholderia sp. A1RI_3L]|uniref:tyrosine-type recombinase/integrase n=1 Tax=Paraburkholderia TaxID=1822464 RepID=UPI0018F2D20F|nr:site-specific integrase [Paraburkholderia kururiensis]